jgi:hypothetical protein
MRNNVGHHRWREGGIWGWVESEDSCWEMLSEAVLDVYLGCEKSIDYMVKRVETSSSWYDSKCAEACRIENGRAVAARTTQTKSRRKNNHSENRCKFSLLITCLCRCSRKYPGKRAIQINVIIEVNIATDRGCLFQVSITIPAQKSPKAPQQIPRALSRTLLIRFSRTVVSESFSFWISWMTRWMSSSRGFGKPPFSADSSDGVSLLWHSPAWLVLSFKSCSTWQTTHQQQHPRRAWPARSSVETSHSLPTWEDYVLARLRASNL